MNPSIAQRKPKFVSPTGCPTCHNTCAVIVTYHPDDQFLLRVQTALSQIEQVVIIDNASNPPAKSHLRQFASVHSCILLKENPQNRGVATALNQGIEIAAERGFEWVLLLDQDSEIRPDFLGEMAAVWTAHPQPDRVAIIGANFWHVSSDLTQHPVKPAEGGAESPRFAKVPTVITSGSLLSLRAVSLVGTMRDDYFIDNVDHEFSRRVALAGLDVLITTKPLMSHAIGNSQVHKNQGILKFLLGGEVRCYHTSALRRYYASRNMIAMARQYWNRDRDFMVWLAKSVWLNENLAIILYESQRLWKLMAAGIGLIHGVLGWMGPASRRTLRLIGAASSRQD